MDRLLLKTLIFIKFFILLNFISPLGFAQNEELKINKITINGEKRLSESFILNYLPNYPNTRFTNEVLDEFIKNLYKTEFFSNIKLDIQDKVLVINLEEFPIINQITFSGNDLLENKQLSEIVSIKSRDVLNLENLNIAVERIRQEYQKLGRYLAEINIKKNILSQGRVNINFDIDEGSLLVVKNVNFVGNKNFSDRELKSTITTKEDAWYKIFGSNKFVPERLEYDKEKLIKFYNERGYIDFKVISAKGDLLPNISGFNINFILSEGQRYKVNDLDFISTSIKNINKNLLLEKISIKKDDFFDSRALDYSTDNLVTFFENKGYNFINVVPSITKENDLVNIKFSIQEGPNKFINRINIVGNTRTSDTVIRRELKFFEGDPFNKSKLTSSIKSLNRLGFFQTVNYKLLNLDNNLLDIIINVQEINTGSVSFGVGYSSLDSTSLNFGLSEKNFLGEGNKINVQASLSDKKSSYNLGVTEPYFLYRHLSLSGNVFNQEKENQKGDIKYSTQGLGVGFGFKQENISQNFNYNISISKSTTSSGSTADSLTGEEGKDITSSSISHDIVKDTTNSFFNPTSGYRVKFSNTFSGIGGDTSFLKSVVNYRYYIPINYGDYIFSIKSGAGFITGLDDKVTSSNRFLLGGNTLRGFDSAGLGPRDTGNNEAVGGNNFYNLSLEIKSDKWLPDETGLEWLLFTDIGSLWGTDYKSGVKGFDDMEPRVTNGFGLSMTTPVGPLQMIWGFPVVSKNYDIEENFNFKIGTTF
ncbi:outer membrane protein assembly factor BamA [Alphaproteobacteria bacterium]|nr:outer membrane protein assembly factor BamA [Alphaproteobacteria bacterium]